MTRVFCDYKLQTLSHMAWVLVSIQSSSAHDHGQDATVHCCYLYNTEAQVSVSLAAMRIRSRFLHNVPYKDTGLEYFSGPAGIHKGLR